LAIKGFAQRLDLVLASDQKVEKSDERTLKLSATTSVDGRGRKGLPDDALTNVCCDEKRDTTAETIPLLKKLIEEQNNYASKREL
jgi:hypothetical protein